MNAAPRDADEGHPVAGPAGAPVAISAKQDAIDNWVLGQLDQAPVELPPDRARRLHALLNNTLRRIGGTR